MVRISFGCYSDTADVDRAVDALAQIAAGEVAGSYRYVGGGYHPDGDREPAFFALGVRQ